MDEAKFLTVQECEDIVKKCLKSDNVETIDFAVVRLHNNNFLIKITVNHNAKEKTLNFFAKSVPKDKKPKIHQILFDDFKKTIPKFDPKITPKFYYGKSELLLFEDLSWQGFHSYNSKHGFLNLDHLQAVLNVLAKFHASSFAFEEIKSQEYGKSYRLNEDYDLDDPSINLKKTEALNVISSLEESNNLNEFLKNFEENQHQRFSKFRKTLCHSNLISENIMFKCKDGVPVDCKLLNFKSRYYASPAYDVLQLIFFNSSEFLRQHHFDSLITHYYNVLKEELRQYNLNICEIMPSEDLRMSVHQLLPLVKLETVVLRSKNEDDHMLLDMALEEFKEILRFSFLSREDCYAIVKNKMKTTNYDFLSFLVTPFEEVNGYLGDYYKLQIKVLNKSKEEIIKCFVKCIPKSSSSKNVVQESGCFTKEMFIYNILIPKLQSLGINTINECLVSCYFYRHEEMMVFEDISHLNYRSLVAQVPYDFNLMSMAIKKLAKFHGSMMVFEEKISEELGRPYKLIDEFGDYIREIFFLRNATHSGAKIMQTGAKSIIDVVNLFPEMKTKENQENLMEKWPELLDRFFTATRTSHCSKNVLSHGDLWTNNIMVKFDGDKPIDCRFVDFQCTRYCPPAHDFLSILHLTTNRTTRIMYEDQMKEIYHNELANVLTSYNYNINKIYPYQEFIKSVDYIKPQMVVQAICYNTFCICTSEEISSFLVNDEVCNKVFFEDRKEYLVKMFEKSPVYKTKLKECVMDLYDICDSLMLE